MRVQRHFLLVLVLLFVSVCADALDERLFSDLHWRLIGPFRGGRVLAVSGVRGQPNHFYFGSVGGGVWETQDAGRTWAPIFDSMSIASIGALAVASSDPNVLYVGSGEADMRSDIGYGNGMYKSTDAGKTWKHIGLTDSHQIGRVLVHPDRADVLYVAALGHAYGPNEERGVFRSTDGGSTWKKILYKDAGTGAIDLAFGSDPRIMFAALWQTRRPPWNVYPPSYGPGSGLYKSTDGGDTWTQIKGQGFPSEGLGRIGVAVAPANGNIVYALVDAKEGGMYRSDDVGATWRRASGDERIWNRGWYFGGVTVDPVNQDVVYACDISMYKSTDGGKTFLPIRGAPGGDDYHQLWIDPDNPQRMITGADQGAVISLNGGATWSSWYNQPIGQFYHAITDNSFPYMVYGAQQDSGAAAVPSRTTVRDGINLMHFREVTAGGENGYIAPDPTDPAIIYGGSVEKLDTRTGQTENIDPTLAYPEIYRHVWTLPLVFSPRDPRILYFANQYLFRTTDGGSHWTVLSADLTRETLTIPPNLDPVTAQDSAVSGPRRAVIYAIAPSPLRDGMIWIGTDDGLIWLTRDEGAHWTNITPPELTPWSKVGVIEASHFDADTVYAASDRHRLDDYRAYIYRTRDAGKSWTLISNGIPDGSFVNVVREDPRKKGLLYAGTELGMYVSFDDGEHWQPLQLNLPVTSVRDIDVHEDDVVIGTHGRAFWILDQIALLRQIDADSAASDALLFRPGTTYRVRPAGFTGTPFPKDEPMAPNPPSGAIVDYYLKTESSPSVTLEVLDEKGEVLRRFSSADTQAPPDPSRIVVTPDWFARPQVLSTAPGHHRFVWNLQREVPKLLRGEMKSADDAAGVWALPGDYTIRLTAAGRTLTQPLTVVNDPRVKATAEDLAKQHDLALALQAERLKLALASEQVKQLFRQISAARSRSSAALARMLADFEKSITSLTELRADPIPWGAPGGAATRVNTFRYLDSEFAGLQRAIQDADGAPTPDAVRGFETQRAVLQEALKQWDLLKTQALPQLNRALQKEGLAPLN